jgi:hypothetical protein
MSCAAPVTSKAREISRRSSSALIDCSKRLPGRYIGGRLVRIALDPGGRSHALLLDRKAHPRDHTVLALPTMQAGRMRFRQDQDHAPAALITRVTGTRHYACMVDECVTAIGLRRAEYGTHALRRTNAPNDLRSHFAHPKVALRIARGRARRSMQMEAD